MDIEKMKRELAAIREGNNTNSSSNSDGLNYFKMDPNNKYQVRVLEPEEGPTIREYHWHWNVAGNKVLCNKRSFNEDCPVCELASAMWREFDDGGRTDASLGEAAKNLFAKNRFYTNVVDRDDEEAGPKIFSFGKRVAEMMYESFLDPDYDGKFLDPENGFDFKINYTREDLNNPMTSKTLIKASPKSSPLAEDSEVAQNFIRDAYNLDEIYTPANPEDVMAILDKYEAPIDTNNVGTAKYGADEGSSDVMSAINRLENSN